MSGTIKRVPCYEKRPHDAFKFVVKDNLDNNDDTSQLLEYIQKWTMDHISKIDADQQKCIKKQKLTINANEITINEQVKSIEENRKSIEEQNKNIAINDEKIRETKAGIDKLKAQLNNL